MADFGKTTIGGTSEALAIDDKRACKFTAPGDIGELDSITVYANRTGTGAAYAIRGGVYTDNAGAPDALVANSAIEISAKIARNAPAWYPVSYVTKPTLSPSTVYWLVVQAAKASLTYFDTGAAGQEKDADDAYSDGLENPFGAVNNTHAHELSIYVSYTTGGPVTLAAVVSGVATVSGAFAVSRVLAAAPAGVATVSAILAIARPLAATSAGIAAVSGALALTLPLAAAPAGVSTVTAAITVQAATVDLAAVSNGVSTVSAALAAARPLAALSAGVATITAAIAVARPLASASAGVATVAGDLAIARPLAGVSAGSVAVTAALTVTGGQVTLAGVSAGASNVSAALVVASWEGGMTTGSFGYARGLIRGG